MKRTMKARAFFVVAIAAAGMVFAAEPATESSNAKAYSRYRFAVDAPRSSTLCMQLSEIQLFDETGAIVSRDAFELDFVPGEKGRNPFPENESPGKAVDGKLDTKWLDFRAGLSSDEKRRSNAYLEFRFPSPKKLSGYAWHTANDFPDRDPSSWRLLGSDDGKNWSVLDKVASYDAVCGYKSLAYRKSFSGGGFRFDIDAAAFPEKAEWVQNTLVKALESYADTVAGIFLPGYGRKKTVKVDMVLVAGRDEKKSPGRIAVRIDRASDGKAVFEACFNAFVCGLAERSLKGAPFWLSGGIAEWTRWSVLEGPEGAKRAKRDACVCPNVRIGGRIASSFAGYLEETYGPGIVPKLSKACRGKGYRDGVWQALFGKKLGDLEKEWTAQLKTTKPRTPKIVSSSKAKDILDWIDPFIGTAGTGHTTPAAAYPFGMVQPGPDTGLFTWEHCSGYQYGDGEIARFSQTHLSGTGCGDFADVGFMPFAGDIEAARKNGFKFSFSKKKEYATPGYYSVVLDSGVKVEATCSEHVAIYRITFGRSPARLLFDPRWGYGRVAKADIKPMKDRRVLGEVSDRRGWPRRSYRFAWEVSRTPTSESAVDGEEIPQTVYSFDDMKEGDVLYLKVSLSRSSPEGAAKNIEAEIPGWDFDAVKASNRAKWREIVSRVSAKAEPENLKNLYTAIYHLCFQPNRLSDAGEEPVYSTFSCWDIYRAAAPLYTILVPEYVPSFVNSMLWHFDRNGFLPVWTLWGKDNQCMIGVHSVPIVTDAYLKGFAGVDWQKAYECIRATLRENRGRHKANYHYLDKYGYYPCDLVKDESVSRLLEGCYDDACAARFAQKLGGRDEDAKFFRDRSLSWTNCFHAASGFVRAKDSKGKWREPFDPYKASHNNHCDYTEGNAFHWNWHVMQSPDTIVDLLGGKDAALFRLAGLFEEDTSKMKGAPPDVTGLIGQYCHGNEPSHHNIYFFTLLGRRDLAAKYIREVCCEQYYITPDGICGNEDCGQMSAWYVFSVLGMYPFDPCGGKYVLGEAQFAEIAIKTGKGKVFKVVSDNPGEASAEVLFNGRKIKGASIAHKSLVGGGTLRFAGKAPAVQCRYEYEFDSSEAPEMKKWMDSTIAPLVREWYPKLVDMFASCGYKPYKKVKFGIKEKTDVPGYAAGSTVALGRKWFSEHPEDIGCAIHELFHVVHKGTKNFPGWLMEGITDYVRFYIYEPESKGCEMDVTQDDRRYCSSYRVTANFLAFVEKKHPGVVKELVALSRAGLYNEDVYWKSRTGKTILELEKEWKGK